MPTIWDDKVSNTCSLFVWGITPYQQYLSFLRATVHKSMFPGLSLTNT